MIENNTGKAGGLEYSILPFKTEMVGLRKYLPSVSISGDPFVEISSLTLRA